MRFRFGILLVTLFISPCLLLADQVTLKNGDRVSGRIVKRDGDMLIVDDMPPDGFAVHDNCVRKAIRELKQTAEQP